MGVKKLYIDNGVDIEDWMESNHRQIVDCLYNNIFDFVESNEERRVILKVVLNPFTEYLPSTLHKILDITIDFVLYRDEIEDNIYYLVNNLEKYEEYEKCAEVVKLCEKYNFKLNSDNETS